MQGYIINVSKVKDEDLLVTVLNPKKIKTLYRFYGSRHSHIHLGYKIDYEAHPTNRANLFQLRNVSSLSHRWMLNRERFYTWQQFLQLLYRHLRDIDEIDSFYYNLLEDMCVHLNKEAPKRVAVESYISLLEYEGRLHNKFNCFVCSKPIDDSVSLVRAYLPACNRCVKDEGFKKDKLIVLFKEKNSILLEDQEIEKLYAIMLEGF